MTQREKIMDAREITRQTELCMFDAAEDFHSMGLGDAPDVEPLIIQLALGDFDTHKETDSQVIADIVDTLRYHEWGALADEIDGAAADLALDDGRDEAHEDWIRSTR